MDKAQDGGGILTHAALRLIDGRGVSDQALARLAHWLGPAETQRCQGFVRHERRRQFLIGRILLRQALGQLLNLAPHTVMLDERPGQAPCLAGSSVGISISHSGPWVACAVSATSALGLDIEQIDPARDIAALAEQAFGPQRSAELAACPEPERLRQFYTMWSVQEAAIKLARRDGHSVTLFHPELSVVLCSAQPLAQAPQLDVVDADTLVCRLQAGT
jgi:4'-phosphopantetheinyl transferase